MRKEEKFNSEREKKAERVANTEIVKKVLDEWQPVVKRNREKEHLDFRQDLGLNEFRMQAKANNQKKSTLSAFESKLANKLQAIGLASEKDLIKKESALINSKDDAENGAQKPIAENESKVAKMRQLYGEIKARRQAKIKSKVYRSIKKRERNRMAAKQADLEEGHSDEEVKKADRDRAQERLTLRHRNKTKFTEKLKRYADQKEVQKMYSHLNKERKQILKKLDMDVYAELASGDSESEYANSDLEGQAVADIEAAFNDDDNSREDDQSGGDIVAELAKRGRANLRREAESMIAAIKGEKVQSTEGRDKYQREEKLIDDKKTDSRIGKVKESALEMLKRVNRESDQELGKRESEIVHSVPQTKILTEAGKPEKRVKRENVDLKTDLLEGIQIGALKDKYKKQAVAKAFRDTDMDAFRLENEEDDYFAGAESLLLAGRENAEQFEQEREEEFMKEIVEEKKPLKGWGEWAGSGIAEKKVDPAIELEKKRLQIVSLILTKG